MNTDTITDALGSLTPEQVETIVSTTGALIVTVTLMNKARKAAKAGDYAKAAYYAILWAGVTNNYNHTNLYKYVSKGTSPRDAFSR